ncbi:hypothetical protein [Segnochrobactrum spirostomi]|uniref:DUF1835 domain-containing protein n=1 Tax=Segnochrobactrum spirostomi TaxID=2608987 RepID=A0A6A7Y8U0_9HYPH|nr:hypothetical protein [Segnochrobactrum spirostomi]MQT14062.1 hypothetical protein [Segnochrobactrum spirostomi]
MTSANESAAPPSRKPVLIVTNGDTVADTLADLRPEAEILPWRDPLMDGPVPPGLDDVSLRSLRAAFLGEAMAFPGRDVIGELTARDAMIERHAAFERVEIWFEPDAADQIQLAQVLDALRRWGRTEDVFLLPAPFHLGPLGAERLAGLAETLLVLPPEGFETARTLWAAFRAPTPESLYALDGQPQAGLPFARAAVRRILEELPSPAAGIGRTERQILYSIDRGVGRVGFLFARVLAMEEAAFLGDISFFHLLSRLTLGPTPLVAGLPEPFSMAVLADPDRRKAFITADVSLTDAGRSVLAGRADRVGLIGLDRWIGGTHLTPFADWRFDAETATLGLPTGTNRQRSH